jgi:hypothetical protein
MLKKILVAALLLPLLAFGQSYPSPTFNNLTVQGTFTATGKVGLGSLAAQAANTVVGNATASSATPTAITVTGCNGAAQALQWTNGSGFGCNSALATSGANANITSLSGITTPLSVAQGGTGTTSTTGSGSVVFSVSPALTGTPTVPTATAGTNTTQAASTAYVQTALTGGANAGAFTTLSTSSGLTGITSGTNGSAGKVGECITSSVASGSGVSLTSGTPANVTSISLTAGDWLVFGAVDFNIGGTTTITYIAGSANTTSATLNSGNFFVVTAPGGASSTVAGAAIPTIRLNLNSTTTVFLTTTSLFASSTLAAFGNITGCRWH